MRFPRGSEEFSRVLAFSDGLFAIAMTLLVVGIGVPELADEESADELLRRIDDLLPELASFFISFAVIGRYWVAHHRFVRLLKEMDYGLIAINLVYLGFVAFLPFPTALLGNYFHNPVAVAGYAIAVAIVSGLEVVLLRHAYRAELYEREMPAPVFRYGARASSLPLVFLLASVPAAFLSSLLAIALWLGPLPAQALIDRSRPAAAADWF